MANPRPSRDVLTGYANDLFTIMQMWELTRDEAKYITIELLHMLRNRKLTYTASNNRAETEAIMQAANDAALKKNMQ